MSHHFPAIDWHTSDVATVLAAHKSDATSGLAGAEANKRLHACGPNELAAPEVHSGVRLLLDQFKDFMTVILLVAAIVSGTLGEWKDALVIMTIVTLNAAIGFTQARRADQAIAALRQLAAFRAVVLRDGQHQSIAASGLVPGDIVLLEAGNQIPADLRLLDAAQLKVDESALTGESVTVEKHTAVLSSNNLALGDRLNMAFKGTTVTHGRARGLVVATGMGTELGKVANLMGDALDRRTPLQQRLARFSKQLSFVILAICAAMFGMGLLRGENPLYMLMTVISLAVAAIPEALPAVVTVLLAIGARRMANFKALIRRLPGFCQHHLFRQDRHPDAKPHARGAGLGLRRALAPHRGAGRTPCALTRSLTAAARSGVMQRCCTQTGRRCRHNPYLARRSDRNCVGCSGRAGRPDQACTGRRHSPRARAALRFRP